MLTASAAALAASGFDLVHPFDAVACATEVGAPSLADSSRALGLFIGNTRALWPKFVAARAVDPELATASDPLELYTERTLERVAQMLPDARVWFGHRSYDGAFLPFQRLAVAAGIGTLAPTQFVIHPIYGPWFALRAVILCAGEPVTLPRPSPPCTCDERCHGAFARAVAATGPDRWRAWLAVRDACPVGREHRYSDEQIAYHYSFMR